MTPADGVRIPDALAGDVLRRLAKSLTDSARSTGARVPEGTVALLRDLEAAAQRHKRGQFAPVGVDQEPEPAEPAAPERTVREAALQFRCSERWVRAQLADGALEGRKVGNTWLVAG